VEGLVETFCREARVNLAEFTLQTPFPGTPFFEACRREGRLRTERWELYNGAHVVFDPVGQSPGQLRDRYRGLWRAFYGGVSRFDANRRYAKAFGREILGS
jgi:hypothetical protein